MRRFDPTEGPRAGIYRHYRGYAFPQFTLVTRIRVDVARLKAEGGLFPNLLWGVMEAAQAVPELRQRIRVDEGRDVVVEHEVVDCTVTAAKADDSFQFCFVPRDADRERFVAELPERLASSASSVGLDLAEQRRDDMLYLSSVPWFDVVGVNHAMSGDPTECIPRVLWGRVVDGEVGMALTAHHSLVDGRHMARFFDGLQERVG